MQVSTEQIAAKCGVLATQVAVQENIIQQQEQVIAAMQQRLTDQDAELEDAKEQCIEWQKAADENDWIPEGEKSGNPEGPVEPDDYA